VSAPSVRPLAADDLAWAVEAVDEGLGGRFQARRGELVDALAHPGLVAERDGARAGLLTYDPTERSWELVLLVATVRRCGVGTALVRRFLEEAAAAGASGAWVVTTGNNHAALALYERCGFEVAGVRRGAVDDARRRLKPTIPDVDGVGRPIRDEVDLTIALR
jgi:ribosomal protein S18 acetylase RimI-like enzyme